MNEQRKSWLDPEVFDEDFIKEHNPGQLEAGYDEPTEDQQMWFSYGYVAALEQTQSRVLMGQEILKWAQDLIGVLPAIPARYRK